MDTSQSSPKSVPNVWDIFFDPVRTAACCACESRGKAFDAAPQEKLPSTTVKYAGVEETPADLCSSGSDVILNGRLTLPPVCLMELQPTHP